MKERFVNLTPHSIDLIRGDKVILSIPPSGNLARSGKAPLLKERCTVCGHRDILLVKEVECEEVFGLPEPQDGVVFLVSNSCALTLKRNGLTRTDVMSPWKVLYDNTGKPVGCLGLKVL